MAPRKTATHIDPVAVTAAALKAVKVAADYQRIGNSNPAETVIAAWEQLTLIEQQRIRNIVDSDTKPTPQAIADELAACGTKSQLESVKAEYGDLLIKQSWKLLEPSERIRIKNLCDNGQREEPQPVTEHPATYQVEPQPQPKRTLFSISDDLEKLNDLLDEVGDDSQQQILINDWFEQLGNERDRKLDSYASLISEMIGRSAIRKAEAQRLMELVATDENRAKLLRDRLKWFFETHDLKTIETARYRLSLAKNGGKAPLIMDESVPVTTLPEQFQKVSINPDTTAIREVLESGKSLDFARLAERGVSMRIK